MTPANIEQGRRSDLEGSFTYKKISQPNCNFCLVIRQMEKQQQGRKDPWEADLCKCGGGLQGPAQEPPWERGKEGSTCS